MKILIDAMGGDNAPLAPVMGAIEAIKRYGVPVILVGREDDIMAAVEEAGCDILPDGIEICHAEDVVDMHDDPANVIRKKPNSSMVMGLKMLSEGQADAMPVPPVRCFPAPLWWSSGSRASVAPLWVRRCPIRLAARP